MTDLERFQAFLDEASLRVKIFPSNEITELPMGSPEDIYYVTHDTVICFSYCDLFFREGAIVAISRCPGRRGQHDR